MTIFLIVWLSFSVLLVVGCKRWGDLMEEYDNGGKKRD